VRNLAETRRIGAARLLGSPARRVFTDRRREIIDTRRNGRANRRGSPAAFRPEIDKPGLYAADRFDSIEDRRNDGVHELRWGGRRPDIKRRCVRTCRGRPKRTKTPAAIYPHCVHVWSRCHPDVVSISVVTQRLIAVYRQLVVVATSRGCSVQVYTAMLQMSGLYYF